MPFTDDVAIMDRPPVPETDAEWVSLAFAASRAEGEACARILAEVHIPSRIVCESRQNATVALMLRSGIEILVPADLEMQAAELVAGRLSETSPVCDGGEDDDDFTFDDDEEEFDDDDDDDDAEDEFDDLDDDMDDDDDDDFEEDEEDL